MPDVVSEIREIIKERYDSEEEFVREGLKAGGPEFVKLLTPDELIGLTPEQIMGLFQTKEVLRKLSKEQRQELARILVSEENE